MKVAIAFICALPLVATADDAETPIPESCPVTRATAETRFTPPPPSRAMDVGSTMFWYGTDALYTALFSDGRWRGIKSSTGTRNKSFWHRKNPEWEQENPYQFKVTYREHAETGPMFTVGRVTNAILGGEMSMLIMLELPTRGCWEVTANYKDAYVSFVTWVD